MGVLPTSYWMLLEMESLYTPHNFTSHLTQLAHTSLVLLDLLYHHPRQPLCLMNSESPADILQDIKQFHAMRTSGVEAS